MTATDERPRLYELRTEQGWTQQEVVDRMARLVWARDGKPIGVTTDMYSKWERGAKGVSPRYRALLARVFKVSVDQLGLPGLARGHSNRRDDQSLVAVLDQAADLLDQLGEAGRSVRSQVLSALTDDVLSRRTVLSVVDEAATSRTPPTPDELDILAAGYEAARTSATPAALMPALTAHLRIVGDALTGNVSMGTRQRLLRNRARVALFAGQLAAEELGTPMTARAYYSQATDDAYETDDNFMLSVVHACSGRLALAEGHKTAAARHQAMSVRP